VIVFIHVVLIWFITCVAETKRAPFDFAEGERELVSGFNVEYGSMGFAFLFLREYGKIILMSYLTSLLFFFKNILILIFFGVVFCFVFV